MYGLKKVRSSGSEVCNFIKRRLQQGGLPVNFVNFLEQLFGVEHPRGVISVNFQNLHIPILSSYSGT